MIYQRKDLYHSDLARTVERHFGHGLFDQCEAFVLTHDYGWSPEQIVEFRVDSREDYLNDLEAYFDDCLAGDEEREYPYTPVGEVMSELTQYQQRGWDFDGCCDTFRVFLCFYFLEIMCKHRDSAIQQASRVYALINDDILRDIGATLKWALHQVVEFRHLAHLEQGGSS